MKPCKIAPLFNFISRKWTLNILKHLSDNGTKRFNELLLEIKGINPRILSSRLKDLEELGLIFKTKFNETPPRVDYSISNSGVDLVSNFKNLDKWMSKWNIDLK
ncbi:MAG: winged helix-turn-helix transcriptional regulator [Candidatus Woesearchaeota archaeon]